MGGSSWSKVEGWLVAMVLVWMWERKGDQRGVGEPGEGGGYEPDNGDGQRDRVCHVDGQRRVMGSGPLAAYMNEVMKRVHVMEVDDDLVVFKYGSGEAPVMMGSKNMQKVNLDIRVRME